MLTHWALGCGRGGVDMRVLGGGGGGGHVGVDNEGEVGVGVESEGEGSNHANVSERARNEVLGWHEVFPGASTALLVR